jgi:hypothetical protein
VLVGVTVDVGVIVCVGVGVISEFGLEAALTHFSSNIKTQARKPVPVPIPNQQKKPHFGGL